MHGTIDTADREFAGIIGIQSHFNLLEHEGNQPDRSKYVYIYNKCRSLICDAMVLYTHRVFMRESQHEDEIVGPACANLAGTYCISI